ncbi:MAG: TetR/AcrR family transcriptional regulator [Pseudomonadota bacterium]
MSKLVPPPSKPTRKTARREALLDAAEKLTIVTGGAFEMSDFARAAHVSAGLAYHYFGSKDGLIEAVIDRFYQRYVAVLDQPTDPDITWPVRERMRLEDVIAFVYADPFAATVFSTLAHKRVTQNEWSIQQDMVGKAARNIRSGQRRGHIPTGIDSELAGAAIIGGVRAAMITAMRMSPRPAPDKVADQLWLVIEATVGMSGRDTGKSR